jgi:hypothetical protein
LNKKHFDNVFGVDKHFFIEINKDLLSYQYQTQGHKKRKFCQTTTEEKIDIMDAVLIKKEYHQDVASRFGVSRETIKNLVKNMKKNPGYLRKLHQKDRLLMDKEK